ncbi:MAG: hypothetical protein IEMM0003_0940 [bacterium]|nr:MAG: hypothetical protein IEMM0003_0940 [bacterium]
MVSLYFFIQAVKVILIKYLRWLKKYGGKEFKPDTATLTLENGKTIKETAEDLDVSYSILCK